MGRAEREPITAATSQIARRSAISLHNIIFSMAGVGVLPLEIQA